MAIAAKKKKTCKNGHQFYKTSDCPTCPICEAMAKPESGFLSLLAAPARRALTNQGITTLVDLSALTEKEVMSLHSMGKASIPILKSALAEKGLSFRK